MKCIKCGLKVANFGKGESMLAEYCKECRPDDSYIDIKHKKCIVCKLKRPYFGKENSMTAEYCKECRPDDNYIDVINKKCIICNLKRAYFAQEGTKTAKYCKDCKPDDSYINIKSKKCIKCGLKQAFFGKGDSILAEYCKTCRPDDSYIDIRHKRCIICKLKRASFSKENSTLAEYCKDCRPDDNYIDIISKRCIKCGLKIAIFGKGDSTLAEYCKECRPDDSYINIKSKKCIKCGLKQATHGKRDSKLAEYCCSCRPDNSYIDIKSKKCLDCDKRPSYNYIGYSPIYCTSHKKPGMITRPIKRCDMCNKIASYYSNSNFYCSIHANMQSCHLIHDICSICCIVIDKGMNICNTCKEFTETGITIRRKNKELRIKELLEKNVVNFIHDKVVTDGCSKKRPDFLIPMNWGYMVIEIDEFQHNAKTYPFECEVTRMKQIYFDIGCNKLLFIRYNPDDYEGKVLKQEEREKLLIQTLKTEIELNDGITVLYLFYDGYQNIVDPKNKRFINPYENTMQKVDIKPKESIKLDIKPKELIKLKKVDIKLKV